MQDTRFELKYVVEEQRIAAMREFFHGRLVPDPYTNPQNHNSYDVYSLYLDNASLLLYQGSQQGLRNRFKLRIRFYDDEPGHPAYLEVKRRIGDVIHKERATVTREAAQRLANGASVDGSSLLITGPKSIAALHSFRGLCREIGAGGMVYVCYNREAYVSPESEHIRVTFDRLISGDTYPSGTALGIPKRRQPIHIAGVVLELKYTNRFPLWMQEFVRAFDLRRMSLAKYVHCLEALRTASSWGTDDDLQIPS